MTQPRPLLQRDRPPLPPSHRPPQLQFAKCTKNHSPQSFPAIPKSHFVIVTPATRSAMNQKIPLLPLQPPTLQPDLQLSLLLHAPIQPDPRRRSRSSSLMPSSLPPKQPIRSSLRQDLLHCTFDIRDIVDPVPLPEPLPIGSANGSIISATHSGRSHLSPLILVHYVPESKVKLLSLGALTRQRFTYSIGPRPLWQASLHLRPPA